MTAAKEPGHKSAKETVKTIACGNAGCFRGTRCYSCAFYHYQVHTRPRVQRASGVPHALFGREIKCKTSGALRGEAANVCLELEATSLREAKRRSNPEFVIPG